MANGGSNGYYLAIVLPRSSCRHEVTHVLAKVGIASLAQGQRATASYIWLSGPSQRVERLALDTRFVVYLHLAAAIARVLYAVNLTH